MESGVDRIIKKRFPDLLEVQVNLKQRKVDPKDKFLFKKLLHQAVIDNNIEIVKIALDASVDIKTSNRYGNTLVHLAIRLANTDIIKLLLNHPEIDVDIENKFHISPFLQAISHNRVDYVQLMLPYVRNIFKQNVLHEACKTNNTEMVNLILQQNIDINKLNHYFLTPLQAALLMKSNENIIRLLLKHGAHCDEIVLQYVLIYNKLDIVNLILQRIGKKKVKSIDFDLAAFNNIDIQIVNLLLCYNIGLTTGHIFYGVLQLAAWATAFSVSSDLHKNYKLVELCLPLVFKNDIWETFRMIVYKYYIYTRYTNDKHIVKKYNYFENPFRSTKQSWLFDLIDLLAFEGGSVVCPITFYDLLSSNKEGQQFLLLLLMNENRLVHNIEEKVFYYSHPDGVHELIDINICSNYKKLLSYFNELEKMKSFEISPTHKLTYFQFLCMNKYQIVRKLKSEEIYRTLENYRDIQKEFPRCSWLILRKFAKSKNLYRKMNKVILFFAKLFKVSYEQIYDFMLLVLKMLTIIDLSNLMEAISD